VNWQINAPESFGNPTAMNGRMVRTVRVEAGTAALGQNLMDLTPSAYVVWFESENSVYVSKKRVLE
jgi:hypothetical protein